MATIEYDAHIACECRFIFAVAVADILQEDGFLIESLWNAEIDVMEASE